MQNINSDKKSRSLVVKRTGQKESFAQTLKEIWSYREMIVTFVRKDLRGRYKGSVLGFLWTFINPLLQLLVYTVVFSTILQSPTPMYYLHLFVALIPWIFFSSSVLGGANAILAQKEMVKKIYFPREVLPISTVTTNFMNMLFCFIVVLAVVIISSPFPLFRLLWLIPMLIPVMIIEYILALGAAFFVAAVTVYLRDLEHILGIVMMAWQFLTPVLYSIDIIPENIRYIFRLNPMTSIIEAYRALLYHGNIPNMLDLLWSLALGIIVLVIGWITFEKLKRRFAEEL